MRKLWSAGRWLLLALGLVLAVGQSDRPAYALGRDQLGKCRDFAFSTEQSFIMQRGEPPDGNRWISDGDLLAPTGTVCARNADLTRAFSPTGAPLPDLGLDGVDIVDADAERYLVAFSTEIDHPRGAFKSGDLLTTQGAVIPNVALVAAAFGTVNQTPYDVGLDELKFLGALDDIHRFLDFAKGVARDAWLENPGRLREELTRFKVDILFSTEEAAVTPNFTPVFLDGDILSARTGARVFRQDVLLAAPIPAGIPDRGVDFGVDAFAIDRQGSRPSLIFSTEISYESPETPPPSFTDGDALRLAGIVGPTNSIAFKNNDLIQAFGPAVKDLGLDALYRAARDPFASKIQELCDESTLEFDGGEVAVGAPGTGLYMQDRVFGTPKPPRRPCGDFVPIDGSVPVGATKFRVAYRKDGDPRPAYGTPGNGIRTEWWLAHRDPAWLGFCYAPTGASPLVLKLETDADGWMDATHFYEAKNGLGTYSDGCVNAELRLAVWDSTGSQGAGWGPSDPNGHYVVWLEWEDAGGPHQENADHHIQLDNKAPTDAPGANGAIKLELRRPDGVTPVPPCSEVPANLTTLQVWAQFDDPHYWFYEMNIKGGNPPTIGHVGPHNYWDADDGTPGLKNTDATGTQPDGTLVHVRDIDMSALLGASFTKCCYLAEIYVWDATLRYSFNHMKVNSVQPHYSYQFLTFSAGSTGP